MGEDARVSEIHRYPNRPRGFEEPLFHGRASKLAVMEHFLEAPWLRKASELPDRGGTGTLARAAEEPVEIRRGASAGDRSGTEVVLAGASSCRGGRRERRGPARRRGAHPKRVRRVLGRWREVRGWWLAPTARVDRLVFRLELAGNGGGAVVDVALDKASGRWLLVGVAD